METTGSHFLTASLDLDDGLYIHLSQDEGFALATVRYGVDDQSSPLTHLRSNL